MFTHIRSYIKGNSFLKSILWVAGGTAFAQGLSIGLSPVYTRLYTPENYGIVNVMTAMLGLMAPLATLNYATTIPLADKDELAEDLLKLCIAITTLFGLVLLLVVLTLPKIITNESSIPHSYLLFLPASYVGAGWYTALSSWAIRHKQFKIIAKTRVLQSLSSSTLKLGFGLCGIQVLGLLLALLANNFVGNGSLLRALNSQKKTNFTTTSFNDIKVAAKRYFVFSSYRTMSRFILAVGKRSSTIFIATYFGLEVAGHYGFAMAMIHMPMALVGDAVAQVYYGEIAAIGKHAPNKIFSLSISIIKKMSLISVVPFITLFLFGPFLFSLVFGEQWQTAGLYARYLSFTMVTSFVTVPIMHCLNVFERQGTQLFINTIQFLLVLLVFWSCHTCDLTPLSTIIIYSVCESIFYLFVLILSLYVVWKQTTTPIEE